MRFTNTLLLAIAWIGGSAPASAQEAAVLRQLDQFVATVRQDGLEIGPRELGALRNGEAVSFTTRVPARGQYQIQGACDNDCTDLDLSLKASWVIGQDYGPSDQPVITIPLYPEITYTVQVIMARCTVDPCNWGVQFVYDSR